MMLRSASTPSLVSSFMENPAAAGAGAGASPHRTSSQVLSCNIGHAPGFAEIGQRAQSAGNLEEIFNISLHADATLSRQSSKRINALEVIPSFCSSDDGGDGEAEEEEEEYDYGVRGLDRFCDVGFAGEGKMYLAAGIGVNAVGFLEEAGFGGGGRSGGGYNYRSGDGYRDGGDNRGRGVSVENHYKNMLLQWPGNSLVLRNYAHFLYKRKRDLVGAEEYYSRAILAEPDDGELLCEYGKLIWELHRDRDTATSYFERALMVSSGQNCNVSASYASFLWDLDDEEEDAAAAHANPHPTRSPFLLLC